MPTPTAPRSRPPPRSPAIWCDRPSRSSGSCDLRPLPRPRPARPSGRSCGGYRQPRGGTGERPYRIYGKPGRLDVPGVCPSHPADVPPASYVRSDLARGPNNSHRRRDGERRRRARGAASGCHPAADRKRQRDLRDPRQVPPGFRTGTDTHAALHRGSRRPSTDRGARPVTQPRSKSPAPPGSVVAISSQRCAAASTPFSRSSISAFSPGAWMPKAAPLPRPQLNYLTGNRGQPGTRDWLPVNISSRNAATRQFCRCTIRGRARGRDSLSRPAATVRLGIPSPACATASTGPSTCTDRVPQDFVAAHLRRRQGRIWCAIQATARCLSFLN
jgi:hypothetical protein